MKTKLTILILLLWTGNCWAAELLVRAKPHWMDSFTQTEVDKLSPGDKQSYEARSQIGDIVVVRPDGWKWGKEECLPNFVVVKVPGMSEAETKQYENPLMVQNGIDERGMPIMVMLRHRKYALPKTDITVIKTNTVTFSKTSLIANTITKIGLASEISAPINSPIGYLWRRITKKVNPYLNTAYNYWVKKCFAAEFLKKTVMPSGGDYTSLEACMNANEQDLTGDGWFTVEIDGIWSSADTTAVTIHNYITTANDYINIYTTSAARHKGLWSSSYYSLAPASGINITLSNSNVKIKGIQFLRAATAWNKSINVTNYLSNITVAYNIFDGARLTDAGGSGGIGVNQPRGNFYVYNNISYDFLGIYGCAIFDVANAEGDSATNFYIYNNTGYNCSNANYGYGISVRTGDASHVYIKNNLFLKNKIDINMVAGIFAGSNNVTSDGTGDDSPLTSGQVSKTDYAAYFASVTSGSEDLHLLSTCEFIDDGIDLSAEFFTDDIDGVTRSGTWDIGADEYVAAGGAVDDSQVFFISKNDKWTYPRF